MPTVDRNTTNTTPPGPRQLVLLGAGHAQQHLLQTLAAHPIVGVQVTLVAPHTHPIYPAMVPGLVAGHYALDECTIALDALVKRGGMRWLPHAVRSLNAQEQTLELDDGSTLHFDWLSVNTGAIQNREQLEHAIPGVRAHGLFVRPLEAFAIHWPRVAKMGDARALRVAVVGGGATGIELALAVRHRLPNAAVTLLCGSQPPGSNFPATVQRRLLAILKRHKVTVLQDRAVSISADAVHLGCGAALVCDVPLIATGVQAPPWLASSGLALDDAGFIAVDMYQRSTSHSRVFAPVDASTRADRTLARSGMHAAHAGSALVHTLAAAIAGTPLKPYQPPVASLNLLSCGDRYAIGTWASFSAQGWWLWWLKNRIDRRFVAGFR